MTDYGFANGELISKSSYWKNIEQHKLDARNGRRGKKQGTAAAAVGASVGAYGFKQGGADSAKKFYEAGKNNYKGSEHLGASKVERATGGFKASGRAMKLSPKAAMLAGAAVGGTALVAGGSVKYLAGLGKEKHAEKQITIKRRKRGR